METTRGRWLFRPATPVVAPPGMSWAPRTLPCSRGSPGGRGTTRGRPGWPRSASAASAAGATREAQHSYSHVVVGTATESSRPKRHRPHGSPFLWPFPLPLWGTAGVRLFRPGAAAASTSHPRASVSAGRRHESSPQLVAYLPSQRGGQGAIGSLSTHLPPLTGALPRARASLARRGPRWQKRPDCGLSSRLPHDCLPLCTARHDGDEAGHTQGEPRLGRPRGPGRRPPRAAPWKAPRRTSAAPPSRSPPAQGGPPTRRPYSLPRKVKRL